MRKLFKSKITFLLAVILLVTVAVASTFALLMVVTQSLRNLFSPPTISCQTTYDDDTDTWTVTNDGDVEVYVRVAVVPYLTNASDKVFWNTPACTVTYDDTKWSVLGEHGYYYYGKTLAPNETVVFGSAVVDAAAAAQFGFDVSKVVVNAEAFQVGSDDALLDAWGVVYDQESGFSAEGACTHSMAYVNVSNEYHKYVCSACGYVSNFARHSLTNATNNDDGTHSGTCACGYNILSVAHTVAYEYVDGTNHTAFCTLCDWSETQTCSYTTDPVLDVGGSTYHRRMCACGAGQELAAHTFTYKDNGDGTHSYWCDTETGGCGYVSNTADHSSMLTDRSETEHTYSCPSCGYAVSTAHDMQMVSAGESGHRSVCVICDYGSTDEPTAHNMTQYTNTGHLNTHVVSCADCGYSVTESHTATRTSVDDTYHRVTCSECGYDENIAHTYTYTSNGEEQHTVGCELCTYQSTVDHELEYEQINESTHTVRCKKCPYTATKNHAITYTITADTHTAKCDQCGYTGSASSHTDFEYTSVDGSTHSVTCGVCGYGFTASHTITYTSNSEGHTPKCDICGYTGAATAHDAISYTNKTDTTHTMTCATCGYVGAATAHTKTNYVSNGSSGHTWTCSVCQKSVTEAHDGNATCVCEYVALTYQKQFSMLSEDMQPLLAHNNGYVWEESVFLIDDTAEHATKQLLYPIKNVIEVKYINPTDGAVTVYKEGEHYQVTNGNIQFIEGSGVVNLGGNFTNSHQDSTHDNTNSGWYWGEGDTMVKYQIRITYTYDPANTWGGLHQTTYNQQFAGFVNKLKTGQDNVKIVFYGDSITQGANSSLEIQKYPRDGYSYPVLFTMALADLYDYRIVFDGAGPGQKPANYTPSTGGNAGTITYVNTSVGGWTSSQAVSYMGSHLIPHLSGCDLFVVALGMNDVDGSTASNVRILLDQANTTAGSGVAKLVVSTMIPNSTFISAGGINAPAQRSKLLGVVNSGNYTNIGLADMTTISTQIHARKGLFADSSGNNVNHPNDFLHRVYAQTLLETVVGYGNINGTDAGNGDLDIVLGVGYPTDAKPDSNFAGFSEAPWGAHIDMIDLVSMNKNLSSGSNVISDVVVDDSKIAIEGWILSTSGQNRIVFSIDGSTWYAAEPAGESPVMFNPTNDDDAVAIQVGAFQLGGHNALATADTTNARFLADLNLTGCEGHTVTVYVALVDSYNCLTVFLEMPNVTIPGVAAGGGGSGNDTPTPSDISSWTSLKTAGNLDGFTTNGNTGNLFPVANWNVASGQVVGISQSASAGLYGWAAFSSVLTDVGYYWDSATANITWQGSLGAETDSAVTAVGGANARRFHVNAPMTSAPSTGQHTVHYVGKLADGTIVEFESWVMNIQ